MSYVVVKHNGQLTDLNIWIWYLLPAVWWGQSFLCQSASVLGCMRLLYLLRPLIPEDPLARHCSLSLSTGSEHAVSRRLALISISRSCLEVPAISVGNNNNNDNKKNDIKKNNNCYSKHWWGNISRGQMAMKKGEIWFVSNLSRV